MKKPRAVLPLVLMGLLAATGVRADGSAAEGKAAKALYNRGMTHFRLAEYDAAIQKWQDGFRLKPVPEFLYNIAQAYRLSKRPQEAVTYYRQFLSMAPNTENRAEVERQITALDAEIEEQRRAAATPVPTPVPTPEPTPTVTTHVDNTLVARPPEKKPIYKKAWFWGVIGTGVVVVAAGVTLGVVFGTRSSIRTVDPVSFP
jgi:tetratricopeptide (TPR) repeat protein